MRTKPDERGVSTTRTVRRGLSPRSCVERPVSTEKEPPGQLLGLALTGPPALVGSKALGHPRPVPICTPASLIFYPFPLRREGTLEEEAEPRGRGQRNPKGMFPGGWTPPSHLPLHADHAAKLGAVLQVCLLRRPVQVLQVPDIQLTAFRRGRPQLLLLG